jgi:hypothetical protein
VSDGTARGGARQQGADGKPSSREERSLTGQLDGRRVSHGCDHAKTSQDIQAGFSPPPKHATHPRPELPSPAGRSSPAACAESRARALAGSRAPRAPRTCAPGSPRHRPQSQTAAAAPAPRAATRREARPQHLQPLARGPPPPQPRRRRGGRPVCPPAARPWRQWWWR